jgi:hypothetical protein
MRVSDELEKAGYEVRKVEKRASRLKVLENIEMYRDGIFEMSRYSAKNSGLPHDIWFNDLGTHRVFKTRVPWVKIFMNLTGNFISVSIGKNPRILLKRKRKAKAENELKGKTKEEMFGFISRNHELILQHWKGGITTVELFKRLKK